MKKYEKIFEIEIRFTKFEILHHLNFIHYDFEL